MKLLQIPFVPAPIILLIAFAVPPCGTAIAGEPTIDIQLATPTVFVHDAPALRLRATAPSDAAWEILPLEFPTALSLSLYGPDGQRVPGGPPARLPPSAQQAADAKISIPAGKTIEWPIDCLFRPMVAGRHRLHVTLELEWPAGKPVEKDLFVDVVEIDPKHVTSRYQPPGGAPRVEVLTIEDGDHSLLVHVNQKSRAVKRIAIMPANAMILFAKPVDLERGESNAQIFLLLQFGKEIRPLSIDYLYGTAYWPGARAGLPEAIR